jgi:hypothetical protein
MNRIADRKNGSCGLIKPLIPFWNRTIFYERKLLCLVQVVTVPATVRRVARVIRHRAVQVIIPVVRRVRVHRVTIPVVRRVQVINPPAVRQAAPMAAAEIRRPIIAVLLTA